MLARCNLQFNWPTRNEQQVFDGFARQRRKFVWFYFARKASEVKQRQKSNFDMRAFIDLSVN